MSQKSIFESLGSLVDSSCSIVSNSIGITANLGSIAGNSLGLIEEGLELGANEIAEYTAELIQEAKSPSKIYIPPSTKQNTPTDTSGFL